jgi:hypothetical protein
MAKLSDLVLQTSEVTGIPVPAVREMSRRLREGGLIGTGKGGRYGGAEMTPSDAASLLTALLIMRASSVSLTDIVPLTKSYLRNLKSHSPRGHQMRLGRWHRALRLPELCRLSPGHTFEDALIALIVSFSNGDFERRMPEFDFVELNVRIISPRPTPEAKIEFYTHAFGRVELFYIRPREADIYDTTGRRKWSDIRAPGGPLFDLVVGAEIRDQTLKSIGLLLKNAETKHG